MWIIRRTNTLPKAEQTARIRARALHREMYLGMMMLPDTEDRQYHFDYLKRYILTEEKDV